VRHSTDCCFIRAPAPPGPEPNATTKIDRDPISWSISMFRPIFSAAAVALLMGGAALGQAQTPPNADQIQPAGITNPQDFAAKAGPAGVFEVQSSQLALQKSQNADIKTFAQKMIDDHTMAADDLKAAAAKDGVSVPDALDADATENLQKLQGATGADFDTLYVQMQTEAHIAAVGLYAGYAGNGTSGAIKDHATKTLPTLKMHYDMVLKLKK
jgi:putative membrane protein